MPSQFDRREERNVGPTDLWFWVWVGLFGVGVVVTVLAGARFGVPIAVFAAIGFTVLAWRRGEWELPFFGGGPPS